MKYQKKYGGKQIFKLKSEISQPHDQARKANQRSMFETQNTPFHLIHGTNTSTVNSTRGKVKEITSNEMNTQALAWQTRRHKP